MDYNAYVAHLRELSLNGLPAMFDKTTGLFVHHLRKVGGRIVAEGSSRRYSAITLIGLVGEAEADIERILQGKTAAAYARELIGGVLGSDNLGDVALTLWAACAAGEEGLDALREKLRTFAPERRTHPTVELAWALDGCCADPVLQQTPLKDALAARLLSAFNEKCAMFPHIIGDRRDRLRAHVSCFADLVYPTHALANYYRQSGDARALAAANGCAGRFCRLQGEAGQWWWHYDYRTGEVIEPYPVYAVHQDAMAPMALRVLREAGGKDFSVEINRGLAWLVSSPEIAASLVDDARGIIWRKAARKEPPKLSRALQSVASSISPKMRMPTLDRIFPPKAIDFESRPYHLGWILYAWQKR